MLPLKTVASVSLAAFALAACGSTDTKTASTPHAKRGGTLTVPWSGDVDSIDPGITYYSGGYMVAGVTQRTPISYIPGKSEAQPDLATALPEVSADARTVTLKLRSGVRFSPPVAREAVAADVKYAIERGFFKTVNNPYAPAYFGDVVGAKPGVAAGTRIRGITTPDEHTVVFQLRRPTGGTLAAALVLPLAAPVPRDYALPLDREKVSGYGLKQVATGPYMVDEYKPGTTITLVRNPSWDAATDYRPAYLDRIEMPQGNEDAGLAARQVLTGSHMVSGDWLIPPAALKEAMTKYPKQLQLVDSGGGRWAALNTTVAPFDNVDVRKAVLAGFDRQAALLALGGKRVGTVATHFLPPGTPGFEQAGGAAGTGVDYLKQPSGDPAVAASYLKRAGYASGRYSGAPVLMVGPLDGNGRQLSEIAKGALEKLGFDVKLRLLSQQTVMTKYCTVPAAAVAVCPNVGWVRDFADGQTYLDPTFNGAHIAPVGNSNVSQLNAPSVNSAIEKAVLESDPQARADAWGAADREIVAQAPAVPLVWDKTPMASSADVDAVVNDGLGVWDFAFTSLR
ncbi:MAG TPA: ABC transporter substrate-binding protein [Solirubrobacter sp.]|nr:ABC transporter substrate-binding protein [Solirubrobacter sp.]